MHETSPLLCLPPDRHACWQLLKELIELWYGPFDEYSGYTSKELDVAQEKVGVQFPCALKEWYALAGRRHEVWSQQDQFLPPDQVREYRDALAIYVENQGVVTWGIPLCDITAEDPPVDVESPDRYGPWIRQADQLSKFALYMFAYNLMFAGREWWVYGCARDDLLNAIVDNFPKLEFPDNWWTQSKLFGYRDLVIAVDGADFVSVTALSWESFRTFSSLATTESFDLHMSGRDLEKGLHN